MVGNSATTFAYKFQRTEWRRHESEYETTGMERSIAAPSLRGLQDRSAMNQNGQAAEEKKDKRSWWAGCSQSSSGFQLRGKYFSLDIPLYRTSG